MLAQFRNRYFAVLDLVILTLTPIISLALRVTLPWDPQFNQGLFLYILLSVPVKIAVFFWFGFYKRLWRYASVDAILSILWGVGLATLINAGVVFLFLGLDWIPGLAFPRSIPIIDGMLTLIIIGGTRFSMRMMQYQTRGNRARRTGHRVLIAGAGDAGQLVAREFHTSSHVEGVLIGFVDDDPIKIGSILHNAPVLGPLDEIPVSVEENHIDEIIIAMPTAPGDVIRKIVNLSEDSGITPKTLPGIFELISGDVTVNQLREVQVGDLLRRQPVNIGMDRVQEMLQDKRILVTGAGGSIGSELCNQLSQFHPEKLFALGHGENSLFALPSKIKSWDKQQQSEKLEIIVADVRDFDRLRHVFQRIKPEIVFHAAAHKHVPLMEDNLEDAITNNILGTKILLDLCLEFQVNRFIYISTDKAVDPISVMGKTKKVGENIVRIAAHKTGKPYVSVRFGNVLGSRGSVVPYFKNQIANGGPVTITHPEVERFFMTIPEAVQLVIQAAVLGVGDEIFVLDMGAPIKIKDLALDLIQLSGLEVGKDIDLVYTGLRPGEKLSEQLFAPDEMPQNTEHEKLKEVSYLDSFDQDAYQDNLEQLINYTRNGKLAEAGEMLEELTSLQGSKHQV